MGKGRAPCCDKSQVKRGPWSPAEDMRLIAFIQKHGHENWRALPKQAGLLRCGKSCRLRWINYLRPDLKRGNFTDEEEGTIMSLRQSLGNKWSKIASHLPGRTDNEIKNHWNTHLKKRLELKGADSNPNPTKESFTTTSSLSSSSSSSSSSVATHASFNKRSKELEHEHNQGTVTKRPRALASVQDLKEHEELPSSSTCSNKSNVTHASQDHVSMPKIEMEAFLDFGGPLEEVNKPDLFNEIANGIQFDCGFEFWNMVDSLSSFGSNELQWNDLEPSQSPHLGDECHWGDHQDDTKNWLRHLEIELGL